MPNGYDGLFDTVWYVSNLSSYSTILLKAQKEIVDSIYESSLYSPKLLLRLTRLLDETEAIAEHAEASFQKARPHIVEMNKSLTKRNKQFKKPFDDEDIESTLDDLKKRLVAHRKRIRTLARSKKAT
jgi:hypothetical protein